MDPELLTAQQCVELIVEESDSRMTVETWRAYAHRGQAPAPTERVGRTPLWNRSEVREWARNRPGRGARLDIARKRPGPDRS